ncbi:MAG: hypothetical protein HY434_00050 [Candidatus Liptonbacteria bacterium]|nr:hypothetical protein [Candidatus Liptonbacteria bacterium]
MTIDELGKIVAELAKSVDRLTLASEREFAIVHKEFEKLTLDSERKFAAVHGEIEKLAVASQKEFTAIRSEMGTKEGTKTVLRVVEGVDLHLSSYASHWSEDFSKLHD